MPHIINIEITPVVVSWFCERCSLEKPTNKLVVFTLGHISIKEELCKECRAELSAQLLK